MSSAFEVLLLGTNSALPMHGRNPTSQYLLFNNRHFLIDCGEGTQHQMNAYHLKRNKIDHIFISHLHGDHVFGLPGLLGSYAHFDRQNELTIYGPPPLNKMLRTIFEASEARFGYNLNIQEINPTITSSIDIDEEVKVTTFPLKHRIPTIGYRFDFTPKKSNIRKEIIDQYQLTIDQIKKVIEGKDLDIGGGIILQNEKITYQKTGPKCYAYCSDTIYDEDLIDFVAGADLLYHETTYLDGLEKEANQRMHSTLGQAIKISKKAKVKKLLTGHYSSRYRNLSEFEEIAKNSSFDIEIGIEGKTYNF